MNYLKSREKMIDSLVCEVFGPEVIKEPIGTGINTIKKINFTKEDKNKKFLPYYEINSNQEILTTETPRQKYGAGILYPAEQGNLNNEISNSNAIDNFPINEVEAEESIIGSKAIKDAKKINSNKGGQPGEESDEEFDLAGSNVQFQSSMGLSFYCEIPKDSKIIIENPEQPCGIYEEKDIYVDENKENRGWWVRKDFKFSVEFNSEKILNSNKTLLSPSKANIDNDFLKLDFRLRVRDHKDVSKKIITAYLVNKTHTNEKIDSRCLYQSGFKIKIIDINGNKLKSFFPYPKGELEKKYSEEDPEEKVLDLIYRNNNTFAIGHGCAAMWDKGKNLTDQLEAKFLPIYESPNITPVIEKKDGSKFEIPMNVLAGIKEGNWLDLLNELTNTYEEWIALKKNELKILNEKYQKIGLNNLDKCSECLERMKAGIKFLKEDELALKAFRWTNEAILTQQLRSSWESPLTKNKKREPEFDDKKRIWFFKEKYEKPDLSKDYKNKGKWRPFQLAFLLSTIQSSVQNDDHKRDDVELIFFPTGGGKTEAYLGLSAFTSFYRRLKDPEDEGVQVIMRYTLRLLTAQQFTRAASLICAMEKIREINKNELGESRFSIGIWVGSTSTPNKMKGSKNFPGALEIYRDLIKGNKKAYYPFLITKCPWCSAHIGQVKTKYTRVSKCIGLRAPQDKVIFKCHDHDCDFGSSLPIYVVDEDIYEKRPTILIGTVDKFVQLTWQPEAKKIFGLNENGVRISSPPSLILQDELHLITGPLGSMYGLYEVIIEELCTENRNNLKFKPKIICSTATIRSYRQQIKDLYNRDKVNLFPPLGLEVEDSFFSKYAVDKSGNYFNPKKYIGLLTTNYTSIQTSQVRIYSRLLYSARKLDLNERDPWFTLMNFFGSLRELGVTTTLIQVDIVDRLKLLLKRYNDDPKNFSKIDNVLELTSRVKSEEIPLAIDKLEINSDTTSMKKIYPVDICLASNIIEVGIDIDRLSLLTILGQPKTTSSYIQVSGRIGRRWTERPGLVCTLYGFRRPRDKSHYEKFTSYHQRLYAQVEPMSVTPFAEPVLNRALHGILVAYIRSFGDINIASTPMPFPEKLINNFKEIIKPRINEIDKNELPIFNKLIDKLSRQWKDWEHDRYTSRNTRETDIGLMYPAGTYIRESEEGVSWSTPNTLRHIDAECNASITKLYGKDNIDGEGEDE